MCIRDRGQQFQSPMFLGTQPPYVKKALNIVIYKILTDWLLLCPWAIFGHAFQNKFSSCHWIIINYCIMILSNISHLVFVCLFYKSLLFKQLPLPSSVMKQIITCSISTTSSENACLVSELHSNKVGIGDSFFVHRVRAWYLVYIYLSVWLLWNTDICFLEVSASLHAAAQTVLIENSSSSLSWFYLSQDEANLKKFYLPRFPDIS